MIGYFMSSRSIGDWILYKIDNKYVWGLDINQTAPMDWMKLSGRGSYVEYEALRDCPEVCFETAVERLKPYPEALQVLLRDV